ncbi:ArsR/SmtB family transcription factor [Kitasatospora sp. NPDC091207]|uniref:ArsR/SmtB family transcription factor n=1 Tax=Kitasatospora sp. NPDC091207 TaxID=3364083 RepID=UPI00381FA3C4
MVENAEQESGRADESPGGAVGEWVRERRVDDAATLKALADPLRLSILGALMAATGGGPLTAKEIAAALGEPQTKLYRHIKQLEKAGLIRVAGTRLVSGIVESRYAAAQESVRLSPEIFSADSPARSEAYDAMFAAMDNVRGDFGAQLLAGRIDFSAPKDGSGGPPGLFAHSTLRVSPARLVRLRSQLAAVFDELNEDGVSDAEDAVDITVFTLLYGLRGGAGGPGEPLPGGAPAG